MLTVTAPAKVNLHLEVLGLRSDGFHELAMVMQSIDLADSLQFTNTADAQITLRCDDSSLSTGADNLVLKAAELLRARSGFNELGVSMYLEKRIPIGAGLAGGSSDGAAALVGLNALWGLGYTAEALESMAAELGSDMPFCVAGGTQLCFGRGELLEPVPPTAEGLAVLLVKDPLVSVSTPWAYQRCKELKGKNYLRGRWRLSSADATCGRPHGFSHCGLGALRLFGMICRWWWQRKRRRFRCRFNCSRRSPRPSRLP